MLIKKIKELLEKRGFVNVASCDFKGQPNSAPKFFLKLKDNSIYLVDYTIGRTWENLKINPRASLSFMDNESLCGYQVNGPVRAVEKGSEYDEVVDELLAREVSFSAKRVTEGVAQGTIHKKYEVGIPDKFVIVQVKIEEIVEIGLDGGLIREQLK